MVFRSAECPSCHKSIQVPTDVEASLCMYCGQSVIVNDVVQISVGPSLDNLMGMARTASEARNFDEALSYYNRVLEIDPKVSEAWRGKGKAAGWKSSLAHMRLSEMLLAFSHSIATAEDAQKHQVIAECVEEANRLIVTLYGMARKNLLEFVALNNSWATYLAQVSQMLDALETVQGWQREDRLTLENIIHLCKDNIEGVSYRDPYQNNVSKVWHLSKEYESKMRLRLNAAVGKLRVLDPSYNAPQVEVKKPDACFVVTATMGDPDHPTVDYMRKFRDGWLLKRNFGVRFVDVYYKYGPYAAAFIGRSIVLRKASFVLVVTPAYAIARRLMR